MGSPGAVRAAALASAASGVVMLVLVAGARSDVQWAGVALGLLALVAAVRLWRGAAAVDHCVMCGVVAVGTALAGAIGSVIVSTVGLPGSSARPVDGGAVALVCLGVAVPAFLVVARLRRRPVQDSKPSYAL